MKTKVKDLCFADGSLIYAIGKFVGFDPRNNWRVSYYPNYESELRSYTEYFECSADDPEHAKEQCLNAYPNCCILDAEPADVEYGWYEFGGEATIRVLNSKEIGFIRCGEHNWFATSEYASFSMGAHPKIQINESCGVYGTTWPEAGLKWYVAMCLAEQKDCAPSADLEITLPEKVQ